MDYHDVNNEDRKLPILLVWGKLLTLSSRWIKYAFDWYIPNSAKRNIANAWWPYLKVFYGFNYFNNAKFL